MRIKFILQLGVPDYVCDRFLKHLAPPPGQCSYGFIDCSTYQGEQKVDKRQTYGHFQDGKSKHNSNSSARRISKCGTRTALGVGLVHNIRAIGGVKIIIGMLEIGW